MSTHLSWLAQLRLAVAAPGNVIAAAGATMLAALAWNPLPLVLYGLGEPIWLYRATARRELASQLAHRDSIDLLERQLRVLVFETPCGQWIRRGHLPDYARGYGRLVQTRDQAARIVDAHHDGVTSLEQDIVVRMDDMLRAYLTMARQRLLLHCMLARVYPELPQAVPRRGLLGRLACALVATKPYEPVPCPHDTPFVSIDDAMREVHAKADGFRAELQRHPEQGDVYRPMLDVLAKRADELTARAAGDRQIAAQLAVFPDQFETIVSKLAMSRGEAGEVMDDMMLLLEQTDDTVSLSEDLRR